jgi:hypothetical protein
MDFLILEISQKWTYTTYSPYNCLISLTDSMIFLCCMTSQYISLNYQILYCMDIPHPSVDRKVPFIFKMLQWSQAWWYTFVIPVTHEVEIRRITIWGQTRQEVSKTTSQPTKKLGVIACACHPRYVGGITGTLQSGMAQEKLWDPIWKITKIKRAGRTGSGGRVPAWDPLFKLQHHTKKKNIEGQPVIHSISPTPPPKMVQWTFVLFSFLLVNMYKNGIAESHENHCLILHFIFLPVLYEGLNFSPSSLTIC